MTTALRGLILVLSLVAVTPSLAADFWQNDWIVPERTESKSLLIRPLQESDSERLFHSYMGSQEWLFDRLGWSWPSEKSSLEQNQSMVKLHLKQQQNNDAYTYIVIDRERDMVIGAVYFVPVIEQRGQSGAINAQNFNAEISWWLTQPAVNDSLHNDLFELLTGWLRSSWPWSQVLFPVAESNQPAQALLDNSSARLIGRNRDTEEVFYSYTLARK